MLKEIDDICYIIENCGKKLIDRKSYYRDSTRYKTIGGQVKSMADLDMNHELVSNLKKIKTNSQFISEELSDNVSIKNIKDVADLFIVDPIDGTASYINGYPGYVIQVAFLKNGIPLYSVVHAPEYGDFYMAIRDTGAYRNNKPIKTLMETDRLIFIDNYPEPISEIQLLMNKNPYSSYLECGSIGLKICRVAEGQANIFFKNVVLKDWDLVPPGLIIQEAGGALLDLQGNVKTFFQNKNYKHSGVIAVSDLKIARKVVNV